MPQAFHAVAKRGARNKGSSGGPYEKMARRRRLVLVTVVVAWFASGALLFSSMNLGPVRTLYLMVQIVTTIGYGDMPPETQAQKLACTAIVLSSSMLVANIIMTVIAYLEDKVEHVLEADMYAMTHAIMTSKAEKEPRPSDDGRPPEEEIVETIRDSQVLGLAWQDYSASRIDWECRNDLAVEQQNKRWKRTVRELSISASSFVLCMVVGAVFFKLVDTCRTQVTGECDEKTAKAFTWTDAFYMSVITMTTVGFGDFVPQTKVGQGFSIFWMLVGVAVTVHLVGTVSNVIDQSLRENVQTEMTHQLFVESDKNHDGHLDEVEFVGLQLVRNGLATKEHFEAIRKQFRLISGRDRRVSTDEYAEFFLPGEISSARREERWQDALRELGEVDAW